MITTTVMETVYRKIETEGVWLVDPRQVTYEQQQAILALRKAGKIEMASYGGLKIKRDWRVQAPAPSATDSVRALLVSAGVDPAHIRECKDARRRSKSGTSWIVVLPKDAKLPANVWAAFEPGWYKDGQILVFEMKRAG